MAEKLGQARVRMLAEQLLVEKGQPKQLIQGDLEGVGELKQSGLP